MSFSIVKIEYVAMCNCMCPRLLREDSNFGVFVWGGVGADSAYDLTPDEIIWYQHHAEVFNMKTSTRSSFKSFAKETIQPISVSIRRLWLDHSKHRFVRESVDQHPPRDPPLDKCPPDMCPPEKRPQDTCPWFSDQPGQSPVSPPFISMIWALA